MYLRRGELLRLHLLVLSLAGLCREHLIILVLIRFEHEVFAILAFALLGVLRLGLVALRAALLAEPADLEGHGVLFAVEVGSGQHLPEPPLPRVLIAPAAFILEAALSGLLRRTLRAPLLAVQRVARTRAALDENRNAGEVQVVRGLGPAREEFLGLGDLWVLLVVGGIFARKPRQVLAQTLVGRMARAAVQLQ